MAQNNIHDKHINTFSSNPLIVKELLESLLPWIDLNRLISTKHSY
jgi:hypothetical protein